MWLQTVHGTNVYNYLCGSPLDDDAALRAFDLNLWAGIAKRRQRALAAVLAKLIPLVHQGLQMRLGRVMRGRVRRIRLHIVPRGDLHRHATPMWSAIPRAPMPEFSDSGVMCQPEALDPHSVPPS